MPRNPHDQFAKQFLEELLAPFGQVELSREILGESRWIDLWFQPHPQGLTLSTIDLGLLGTITQFPCLLEPYRNPPDFDEVRSCLSKHYAVMADQKRQDLPTQEADLPHLWILAPTFSERSRRYCGAVADRTLPPGCYALAPLLHTHIIVLHQLPKNPHTLWLRLLGKGRCQQEAIEEVIALPHPDPHRDLALELLVNWKIALEIFPQPSEEEETFMALSQAYREWELKTMFIGEQRGIQIGEQRGIQIAEQQQRRMILELLEMELELKFGDRGLGLMSYLEAVSSLEDLYELVKAMKRLNDWDQVQQWWFDRLPRMMAEPDGKTKSDLEQILGEWLGVALKLKFPDREGAEIDRFRDELKTLHWQQVRQRLGKF
jgi:hypothetical protein